MSRLMRRWSPYADVRQIMDSDLRARLKEAMPMHEEGQREFQAHTGIDVERISITSSPRSRASPVRSPHLLVVARGPFQRHAAGNSRARTRRRGRDYKGKRIVVCSSNEQGSPVPTQSGSVTLAFLEPGLIAIGDTNAVKNSIDAQLTSHSITTNNEMMELVGDIGQYNNAWAVGRFDLLTSQANLPEQISTRLPPIKWLPQPAM
jgi:hypothetical protein